MDSASKDHVKDSGSTGRTGHVGSDYSSPEERLNRYGTWSYKASESISYKFSTATDIIMQLIISDGDPLRQDRTNIFSTDFTKVSVATGNHSKQTLMQVINYAQEYTDFVDEVVVVE